MYMSVTDHKQPVTETMITLLAGLGVDTTLLDLQPELVIDRFDQWTNPQNAVLACTCCRADFADESVAA